MKKNKFFLICIGIGAVIVLLLILIGNMISIGDKIAKFNHTLSILCF